MKTYAEWAPTAHDRKGLNLPDRQDWLVCPVILTRDSDCLESSNFASCLNRLGGESETLERHEFNHWACGWFAILLLHPSRQAEGEALEERLENYPVLDENDFSNREWAAYQESWETWGKRDFVRELVKEYGLTDRAEAVLEACGTLQEHYESCIPSGDYLDCKVRYAVDRSQRDDVARWIREARREARKGAK